MIATARADDAAAAALLRELDSLVRVATRRSDLDVREGMPGSSWSFDFTSSVINVPPESLRSLAPDLCRGLTLHEAAHAAVTVLHEILPPAALARHLLLFNTIEDIRIEIWMRRRFPGASSWIRAYNDLFYGQLRSQQMPQSRQVQFLRGLLELWWFGTTSPGTLPEVEAAIDTCREPVSRATACQPPVDDDRAGILSSQRSMYAVVRDSILPTWERLVALDQKEGIARLASRESRDFGETLGLGCDGPPRVRCGRSARGSRGRGGMTWRPLPGQTRQDTVGRDPATTTPAGRDEGTARERIAASLGTDGSDAYLTAWKRIGPLADRLGEELLRVLVPRRRLRWTTGHPSGARLELRRAMQFEADRRLYSSLWCRPVLPSRRDAAVVLLVDRSGSMERDGRGQRAFEGLVLLVEVCRRIGVPAAVWSFADLPREELSWDAPLDPATRGRLGRLPVTCDGSTDMAAALAAVRRVLAVRPGDPKLLFVLSDGEPDRHDDTLEAARRLDRDGITTVGLGLGQGTAGLARFFRSAATGIAPDDLVARMAELLGAALLPPE